MELDCQRNEAEDGERISVTTKPARSSKPQPIEELVVTQQALRGKAKDLAPPQCLDSKLFCCLYHTQDEAKVTQMARFVQQGGVFSLDNMKQHQSEEHQQRCRYNKHLKKLQKNKHSNQRSQDSNPAKKVSHQKPKLILLAMFPDVQPLFFQLSFPVSDCLCVSVSLQCNSHASMCGTVTTGWQQSSRLGEPIYCHVNTCMLFSLSLSLSLFSWQKLTLTLG